MLRHLNAGNGCNNIAEFYLNMNVKEAAVHRVDFRKNGFYSEGQGAPSLNCCAFVQQ